jgi:serine/threonine protein kinase
MSTAAQTCDIAIPGYVLTDRIGSGGYAEVWRAEAPGGIQKAVKIVYGHYEDEFASQELKALERIKGVRHPFLLSLERFETVNGRLAILTELADMSLDQRLRQCRAEGLPGIPRDELLRYLADAAEALDFLSQRHNLLHLDIKPENLLILGDHIKVADFGLVKELASRTQNSLVSGMTPAYASPEMFDDEPCVQSDQYSLAIVYQEMLVGVLPFPGRTAAQLAKQHTQAPPQLMSLPVEDRLVIGRALAKSPTDRFPSCRAFVDALMNRGSALPTVVPKEIPQPLPVAPLPSAPGTDDTKPQSVCTTLRRGKEQPSEQRDVLVTQPVCRSSPAVSARQPEAAAVSAPLLPEETVDVAVPDVNSLLRRKQPTLYVAIGGIGIQSLCRLRSLTTSSKPASLETGCEEAIAIDIDRDELRQACSDRSIVPLVPDDTLHVPLRLPKNYDDERNILGWVSRRWLYNIPRSLETRGFRPLGRVALVDHGRRVAELIDRKLQRLGETAGSTGNVFDSVIEVAILASTGGGTGSGMAIDVANLVKSLAAARRLKVEVQGYFVCNFFANNNSSALAAANTYALLTELSHATTFGNVSSLDENSHNKQFESPAAPFDFLYWIPVHSGEAGAIKVDATESIAKYLAQQRLAEVRTVLRTCRSSRTPREQDSGRSLTIKKPGIASLADQKRIFLRELAVDLAGAVKRHWLSSDTSRDWTRLVRAEQLAANMPIQDTAPDEVAAIQSHEMPDRDASPLALRGRFGEQMSLTFASEVLRQIQHQLDSRDDRGRPCILNADAKLIADVSRSVIVSLAMQMQSEIYKDSHFGRSSALNPLVAAGSQRVLSRAVDGFEFKQSERFLAVDTIDELIQSECQELLEESLVQPELAAVIDSYIDLDKALSRTLECATTDLLQCGSDRRMLLLAPANGAQSATIDKLRIARPLAAIVPTSVDDVVVISEDTGISPRSLALGFERVFPGIAEAARRLYTRIDVEWQSPT